MEPDGTRLEAALGAIVIAVIGLVVWLSFTLGGGAPAGATRHDVLLNSALGLNPDNTVAIAGVKVGVVESVVIDGRKARVRIAVDPAIVLHQGAFITLRSKSFLGEKYLDLDPGPEGAPALKDGTTLSDNPPSVEVDDILRSVSTLVSSLNNIVPPFESSARSLAELLKTEDGHAIATRLDEVAKEAVLLLQNTNGLVADSGGDVRSLLRMARERAPGIVTKLDHTVARLDAITSAIDEKRVQNAVGRVSSTMDTVDGAATDARRAMADMRQSAGRLRALLQKTESLLDRLSWIDERRVREMLQEQGVRVNVLPNSDVKKRLEELRPAQK